MKKILFAIMMLFASTAAFAQSSSEDFFIGNWDLFVEGLPTGDAHMLLVVKKDDNGKLTGTIGGLDGSATSNLTKVVIKDNTLQVNFLGGGYDVPIFLDREDDGTVTGSMNDMFDCTGKKIEKE